MHTIRINERFCMLFKVKKTDTVKISQLLFENKIVYVMNSTIVQGYSEYKVDVNIKQAETVRQLVQKLLQE